MNPTMALLRKEWMLELRQRHALAGVVLYVLATVFVCYLGLEHIESSQVWGALLWLTGIFTAFNAMQKAFAQEHGGVVVYLYTLASPRSILLAKVLYHIMLITALNSVSLFFFVVFFGSDFFTGADLMMFAVGWLLGSSGLAIVLTFISGLAFRSGGGAGLIAILGFPVIIPLLMSAVRITNGAIQNTGWDSNALNLVVLLVLNIAAVIMAAILFPYLWRE